MLLKGNHQTMWNNIEIFAYFQIGSGLINRVCNVDVKWHKEMMVSSRIATEFKLTLDVKPVRQSLEQLTFMQMKRKFIDYISYSNYLQCCNA